MGRSGSLWIVVDFFGSLLVVVHRCESLWFAVDHYGSFFVLVSTVNCET